MSLESVVWEERLHQWKLARETLSCRTRSLDNLSEVADTGAARELELHLLETNDGSLGLLSRKVPISPSKINPYRFAIVSYFIILVLFLRFRFTHPVNNAYGLWVASVICEAWFSVFSFLEKLPRWRPVDRETYPERLCLRYYQPGKQSTLASIDVFTCIADRQKESPIVLSNTILSILSVDYPAEKVSCYVSDDGASLLILETLRETTEFARKWIPFCKKFNIEPRAPESYFSEKVDHARFSTYPTFLKARRSIKRKYEEFKVQINGIIAKFQSAPSEDWMMKDGTPWPGNDVRNHPGMIQVMIGRYGPISCDDEVLPQLVYVSRERQPGFQLNDKAGAMNALVRVSALLSNGVYILNLDCNQYINNSKAFIEAMCFMMDPSNDKICFVQFPQRFDCIDAHKQYANHKTVFYDITLKSLDGIQGPMSIGSCCFFLRKALYGYHPPLDHKMLLARCWIPRKRSSCDSHGDYSSRLISPEGRPSSPIEEINNFKRKFPASFLSMEKCFGQSPILIASNLVNDDRFSWSVTADEVLKEAIQVISCNYEDSTAWGEEVGMIYGFQAGDLLTGLRMHTCGWRSVYYLPACAAFRGYASINLTYRLTEVLLSATGSVEILFSKCCPIWYGHGGRLKVLERVAYINATIYPFMSIPLLIYSTLPAICLFSGRFIMPITYQASGWLMIVLLSFILNGIFEMRWSGVSMQEYWRNQQFWLIAGVSSHFFAVIWSWCSILLGFKSCRFTGTTVTSSKNSAFNTCKWTSLLVLPTTLVLINLLAMVAGIFSLFAHGYGSLGRLLLKLAFASGITAHLHPFLKGLSAQEHKIPTVVVLWSLIIAIMFSVLWVRLDPFTTRFKGPNMKDCGIEC